MRGPQSWVYWVVEKETSRGSIQGERGTDRRHSTFSPNTGTTQSRKELKEELVGRGGKPGPKMKHIPIKKK